MNEEEVIFQVVFADESREMVKRASVKVVAFDARKKQYAVGEGSATTQEDGSVKAVVKPDTPKQIQRFAALRAAKNTSYIDIHYYDSSKQLRTAIDYGVALSETTTPEKRNVFVDHKVVRGDSIPRPETEKVVDFLKTDRGGLCIIEGSLGSGKSCLVDTGLKHFLGKKERLQFANREKFFFFEFLRSCNSDNEAAEVSRLTHEFADWLAYHQVKTESRIPEEIDFASALPQAGRSILVIDGADDILEAASVQPGLKERLFGHLSRVASGVSGWEHLKILVTTRRSIGFVRQGQYNQLLHIPIKPFDNQQPQQEATTSKDSHWPAKSAGEGKLVEVPKTNWNQQEMLKWLRGYLSRLKPGSEASPMATELANLCKDHASSNPVELVESQLLLAKIRRSNKELHAAKESAESALQGIDKLCDERLIREALREAGEIYMALDMREETYRVFREYLRLG